MSDCCGGEARNQSERRLLWTVLVLNATLFVVEFTAGWLAQSSGLLADSLDMLADTAVYSLSLFAVGRAVAAKAKAALLNGGLQMALGVLILLDVGRRVWLGSAPQAATIGAVASLALVVNIACFALLFRFRRGDVNLRASWICSRNDMVANVGVLVAAVAVAWLGAPWPDWVIGAVIAAIIIHSAWGILRDARRSLRTGETIEASCGAADMGSSSPR